MKIIFSLLFIIIIYGCSVEKEGKQVINNDLEYVNPSPNIIYAPQTVLYPQHLRLKEDTASVAVQVTIDSLGNPVYASVYRTTNRKMDSLSISVAMQYKWSSRPIGELKWPKEIVLFFHFDPSHKTERLPRVTKKAN